MQKSKLFRPMIPGENLTVNGKNYPWHRPPQYAEFDDAFEFFTDTVFGDHERLSSISLLASNGLSALAITQTLLIQAVGAGKISPDMSILIAGPVYKTLTKMLTALNVRHLTGYDTQEEMAEYLQYMESKQYLKDMESSSKYKLTAEQKEEMERITDEAMEEIPEGGLMGAPTGEEPVQIPMDASEKGLVMAQEKTEEGKA